MMQKIPLILRLKKEAHKKIARAQDVIMEELYKVFNDAVFHGGTAIWRCYNGNRFSEDIDVYIPKNIEKINILFNNFEKKGFQIEKKKIGGNSIFSSMKFNNTIVKFEALFKKSESILKNYEQIDGNFIAVYTLAPEQFIKEKVDAYLKRRKIRDLYDVFFLLKYLDEKEKIKEDLIRLLKGFKKPLDEQDLNVIILEGIIPETKKMLNYIESFTK